LKPEVRRVEAQVRPVDDGVVPLPEVARHVLEQFLAQCRPDGGAPTWLFGEFVTSKNPTVMYTAYVSVVRGQVVRDSSATVPVADTGVRVNQCRKDADIPNALHRARSAAACC